MHSPPATKGQSLQDPFLNVLRRERISVSIFLVNGIKVQGTIESYDPLCILLRSDNGTQLVYKHAIASILPTRQIRVGPGGGYVQIDSPVSADTN